MRARSDTVERRMARIGDRAQGVVARAELLAIGITRAQIQQRLRKGSLLPEYRGVYRLGHRAPSLEARYMAAVKACGGEAVLSGLAAAHLYGLLKGRPPAPHVTAPRRRCVPGIRVRRSVDVERATYGQIPITTVARTLLDIAPHLAVAALARACHEADVRFGVTPDQVEEVLRRHPNAKGAAKLRSVLLGEVITLSALERRFLGLLDEARLPRPATNVRFGRRYLDCRWDDPPLTVELDGYRYHRSRHAWEQDRRREREAYSRGDDFRRYTYGDVFEAPARMLAELRALFSCRRAA